MRIKRGNVCRNRHKKILKLAKGFKGARSRIFKVANIAVNKRNYTNQMIQHTKKFNISVLSENAKFDTFKHFGFQSGRDVDKFATFNDIKRSPNGLLYITKDTNSYMSAFNSINYIQIFFA